MNASKCVWLEHLPCKNSLRRLLSLGQGRLCRHLALAPGYLGGGCQEFQVGITAASD